MHILPCDWFKIHTDIKLLKNVLIRHRDGKDFVNHAGRLFCLVYL